MFGETAGGVRLILRLEGLLVFVGAAMAYGQTGYGWGNFALYFLAPDLALLAYLANSRVGALTYNTTHSYLGAIASVLVGHLTAEPILYAVGLVWAAHIGFDRALGYGLKYASGFSYTHLGRIGRLADVTAEAKVRESAL